MKIYNIIGGVNGAGKSSLTGSLKYQRSDLGTIIDVDKITAQMGGDPLTGGKAAPLPKSGSAWKKGSALRRKPTLAGYRTERTAKEAKEAGYYIRLFYVGLDTVQESLKRIQNRVEKGGHDIPPDDVKRRFSGRFEALAKVLPYCDEAIFFDNDNGFREVGEYRNGELVPFGDSPEWFRQLAEYLRENP